ncbi:MAG: DUF4430 domain-containing protein [bacterium]|nr:DUF4430 domain-containing protein [bacterium]
MKKSIYIISIAAIGAVLFGGQMVDFAKLGLAGLKEVDISQKETQEEEIKGEVVLEINYGDGNNQVSTEKLVKGMTVQSLLENKIVELKSKLTIISDSATGSFIKAIGDKENGQDGKYWLYYVNGQLPMVSVDKKELNPRDKVEFKFEKSPF